MITDVETAQPVNLWEEEFLPQMLPFRWGKLVLGPGDQTTVRIGLRKCAISMDTRVGKVVGGAYEVK